MGTNTIMGTQYLSTQYLSTLYRDYRWIKERIVIAKGHTMNEAKSQPT